MLWIWFRDLTVYLVNDPYKVFFFCPKQNTCIEHMYPSSRCTPWLQHGEQAETLPFPVQESASTGQWPPRDLQLDANSFQTVCKQLIGGI